MPITQCDYSWSQTRNTISITLKLNNVSHKDVDFMYTESYLKVSCIILQVVKEGQDFLFS